VRGMGLVNGFEQAIKCHHHKNEHDRAQQFATDADAEKRLGSANVIGCRRRVVEHNQLSGDIDKPKRSRDTGQKIE
jgi:hypothetical protein